MHDYFNEINEKFIDLTNEYENLFMEDVYVDKLDYLRVLRKKVRLPIGSMKSGYGDLCYLYTHSIDESISIMNSTKNLTSNGKFKAYYYPPMYIGKLYHTRYRYNDFNIRKDIYDRINKEIGCYCLRRLPTAENMCKNLYFDLSRYISIFDKCVTDISPVRYIRLYWGYISTIFNEMKSPYKDKYVVCPIGYFKIGKDLKENLKNPLYALYYTLFKKEYSLIKDIDITFLFYHDMYILKINPSVLTEESFSILRREMKRLLSFVSNTVDISVATDEKELVKADIKEKEIETITKLIDGNKEKEIIINDKTDTKKVTPVDKASEKLKKEVIRKVEKSTDKAMLKVQSDTPTRNATIHTSKAEVETNLQKQVNDELDKDKELLKKIYKESIKKSIKKSTASSARDKLLQEEQANINIDGVTVKDLKKIVASKTTIPSNDIGKYVTTTNENMKSVKFNNFEKEYNKVLMKKDLTDAILSLNDKSIPLYVLSVYVEDTSNELNYKDTYTIKFEDVNRKRHTIRVDIPKFLEDRFLYIGGNKKIIKYQNFFYPIVKIKPDTVLIVSNYNKLTIERKASNTIGSVVKLTKLLAECPDFEKNCIVENVSMMNKNFVTVLEYDEISKVIGSYKKGTKTLLYFNQNEAQKYLDKHPDITVPKNSMFIGVSNSKPVFIDIDTQKTSDGKSVMDVLYDSLDPSVQEVYQRLKTPKRLMTSIVTIMKKTITVGLLLGLWVGLETLLKELKVDYTLKDKIPTELRPNESFLKFSDCVLVYKENVHVELIMNGFKQIETSKYSFIDFNSKIPYLDYVTKVYGRVNIENALYNYYEFMIDPITKEILKDRNQPTDIVGVMIYAIKLLADSQYLPDINQGLNRIRSNEIIPAILYSKLAEGYIKYRNSNGRQKFSIKRDSVISELIGLKTVEDYSTLNPNVEFQQSTAILTKGYKGINLEESYTVPKRSYDNSMIGTIAGGTSPDGNCGVIRYLSLEPQIENLRGYVNISKNEKDIDKLKDVNLFSSTELTIPMGASLDDPNRLGFCFNMSGSVFNKHL